jgi:hypothetical protein
MLGWNHLLFVSRADWPEGAVAAFEQPRIRFEFTGANVGRSFQNDLPGFLQIFFLARSFYS